MQIQKKINDSGDLEPMSDSDLADMRAAMGVPTFVGLKTAAQISVINNAIGAGQATYQAGSMISLDAQDSTHGTPYFLIGRGTAARFKPVGGDTAPSVPLSISGTPVTSGVVGTAYAGFTVTGAGGKTPYAYSLASGTLPPGLSLNASTGVLSGTPTTDGNYSGIVIRVTDALGATANLSAFAINVAAAVQPLSISGTPPSTGQVGTAYNFTPTSSGGVGAKTFSLAGSALPAGLSLNSSTGAITGTPTAVVVRSGIVIRVTDSTSAFADLGPFTVSVNPIPVSISGTPPSTGQVGEAYSFTPTVANGGGTRVFTLFSGTLPAGLSLSSTTGAITGTPTTEGTASNLAIRVTDDYGNATMTPFSIAVAAEPVAVPENISVPVISGTAQQGQTLTSSNGVWLGGPTGYTYQWKRAGVNISGATASTYQAVLADVGSTLTCTVIANNAGGASQPATSAATATVTAAADTRPRMMYAPANPAATASVFNGVWSSAVPLTGSANGGRTGSFNTAAQGDTTLFTWVAVLLSSIGSGIRFYDGVGYGGYSGAQSSNLFMGEDVDPINTYVSYTAPDGNVYAMFRSNGKASTFNGMQIQ